MGRVELDGEADIVVVVVVVASRFKGVVVEECGMEEEEVVVVVEKTSPSEKALAVAAIGVLSRMAFDGVDVIVVVSIVSITRGVSDTACSEECHGPSVTAGVS